YDQSDPVIIAAMQTADGGDTATLRIDDHSPNTTQIYVSEETSKDQETSHPTTSTTVLVSDADSFHLYSI
ncbi:MAG: hypothetical protein AAGC57_21105, partial [Pseudomonadota bacterium]